MKTRIRVVNVLAIVISFLLTSSDEIIQMLTYLNKISRGAIETNVTGFVNSPPTTPIGLNTLNTKIIS